MSEVRATDEGGTATACNTRTATARNTPTYTGNGNHET